MLPSLKKIHSVDYAGQQRQLDGSTKTTTTTTTTTPTTAHRVAPLMHSVSIVVELAVEKQPVEDMAVDDEGGDMLDLSQSSRQTEDSLIGESQSDLSSAGGRTKTRSESKTITKKFEGDNGDEEEEEELDEVEGEEEEEEDDEEAASCLSTDLARKVVIVDEADKILQFRAQSAEPRIVSSSDPDGTTPIATNNSSQDRVSPLSLTSTMTTDDEGREPSTTTTSNPTSASKTASTIRSNTISGRQFGPASASSSELRKWQRANTQTGPLYSSTSGGGGGASVCGSTGELAERGDLAKLGMRRYTHHQVSYYHPPIEIGGSPVNTAATGTTTTRLPGAGYSAQLDTDCPPKKSVSGTHHSAAQTYQSRQPQDQDQELELGQLRRDGDQSMLHRQSSTSTSTSTSTSKSTSAFTTATTTTTSAISTSTTSTPSSFALLALSGGLSSQAKPASGGATSLASGSVKNWSQRRQSLQINLLGSGSVGDSFVCKSLTQEELRGEREFNEQVRNSKSPDSFTSALHHHHHHHQPQHQQQHQQQQYLQDLSLCSSVLPSPETAAAQVLKCQSQTQTASEGAGLLRADQGRSDKIKAASSSNSSISSASSNSANSSQETFFATKTCYQQNSDIPGGSSSQLLLRSAITQKPTRQQPKAGEIQRRRVSFGSIDPIIDRAETSPHPSSFNSSFQHPLNTTAIAPRTETSQVVESGANLSKDSSPTKSSLLCGGTRFAIQSPKLDRVGQQQQTSCSKLIDRRQKRHSLTTTANSALFSGIDSINRRSTLVGSNQDGQQISEGFLDRRRVDSDETKPDRLMSRSTLSKTKKMSDHSSMRADLEEEGNIEPTVNKPLMETFSTTLDGEEIIEDTSRITSATNKAQQPSSGQVKDASRVQSIMANAKLRQEEFARLLEEHEQIVNEIHRVETKMSNSQLNLQQRQQQQQLDLQQQQQQQDQQPKQQTQEQQQENK